MYDHLLFDIDGTLFDFMASEKFALTNLFKDAQLEITDELLSDYHQINFSLWNELEEGNITITQLKSERFRRFFTLKKVDFDANEASDIYLSYLSQSDHMYADTLEVLTKLQRRKIPMSVITNGISFVQHGRIKATNTGHFFSFIAIGEEMGVAKPNPLFFDKTIEEIRKIKIPISNPLVIGDSLSSDIDGAKNGNLESCWINRYHMEEPQEIHYQYEITNLEELLEIL
jgi:YjjG family noncanonical pyrimidine nucleotidase